MKSEMDKRMESTWKLGIRVVRGFLRLRDIAPITKNQMKWTRKCNVIWDYVVAYSGLGVRGIALVWTVK